MESITRRMVLQSKIEKPNFWNASEIVYKPKCYRFKGGGGGGSMPSTTTQTTKSEPWDEQKPFLKNIFSRADSIYNDQSLPEYFPGNTVVPFSPETETALQFQTQRALNGSPVQTAANQQLIDTLGGNYLFGGEGFNRAIDSATRKILPQVDSAFERAGRTGSGLAQTAKTQAVADAFADQYQQERQNQLRGMLFAPQMLSQDYVDAAKLAEVGAQRESLAGENLQDQINRYYGNDPYYRANQELQDYANFIQGSFGGSTSSASNYAPKSSGGRGSPLGGILSGGMMGWGVGGPVGGLAGGLLGGLGIV